MSVMKCTAAGDAMIFRQLPGHYEGFEALRDFIAQGELRFLNLETTIHNFETYGAALSGGSWVCAAACSSPTPFPRSIPWIRP